MAWYSAACISVRDQLRFYRTNVTLPKSVVLHNPALALLLLILQACIISCLIFRFIHQKQYMGSVPLQVYPSFTVVSEPGARTGLDGGMDWSEERFCRTPKDFDYKIRVWSVENATCAPMCSGDQSNVQQDVDCVGADGLVQQSTDAVFIPTLRKRGASAVFVPTADRLTVSFEYGISFNAQSLAGGLSSTSLSSSTDISTVILDNLGNIAKIYAPGDDVSMNMTFLLGLAGLSSELLDSMNHRADPNSIKGAAHPYPTFRTTGVEVELAANCGHLARISEAVLDRHLSWIDTRTDLQTWSAYMSQGEVCQLTARQSPRVWVSQRRDGDEFHGISITLAGGLVTQYDWNGAFINLGASWALLGIPMQIIMIVATVLLGHISTIYYGVLREQFNLSAYCGGMLMRIISFGSCFKQLATLQGVGEFGSRISSISVRAQMTQILRARHHVFQQTDIYRLVDVAYRGMRETALLEQDTHYKKRDSKTGCWTAGSYLQQGFYGDSLDVDTFASGCMSNEKVTLGGLANLFNPMRKKGWLEKKFMPPGLSDPQAVRENSSRTFSGASADTSCSPLREPLMPDRGSAEPSFVLGIGALLQYLVDGEYREEPDEEAEIASRGAILANTVVRIEADDSVVGDPEKSWLRRCSDDKDSLPEWVHTRHGWLPLLSQVVEGIQTLTSTHQALKLEGNGKERNRLYIVLEHSNDPDHRPMGYCNLGHPMHFLWKSKHGEIWDCDGCEHNVNDLERWSCPSCNFDLCQKCALKRVLESFPKLDINETQLLMRVVRRFRENVQKKKDCANAVPDLLRRMKTVEHLQPTDLEARVAAAEERADKAEERATQLEAQAEARAVKAEERAMQLEAQLQALSVQLGKVVQQQEGFHTTRP